MALNAHKITDYRGLDMASLPDKLTGTAAENKAAFDRTVKQVVAVSINGLIDELQEQGADSMIRGEGVRALRMDPEGRMAWSPDGQSYETVTAGGHAVFDGAGGRLPQRGRLQFHDAAVTDDGQTTHVSGIVGPQGPQGERGDAGAAGPAGPMGPAGPVLVPCVDSDGVISFTLEQTGRVPDAVSIRGPRGYRGETGEMGPRGEIGPAGPQGPQGIRGEPGPKGDRGSDGRSFTLLGRYATLPLLEAAHPTGGVGDAYAVGEPGSSTVWLWDPDQGQWTDLGALEGPAGPQGLRGYQGPQGVQGIRGQEGPAGKSAYAFAREGGYGGTEAAFADGLASLDELPQKADRVSGAAAGNLAGLDAAGNLTDSGSRPGDFAAAAHAARHRTGGADPLNPGDIGAEGAGTAAALVSAHAADSGAHTALFGEKADKSSLLLSLLYADGWEGESAPWSYFVDLPGLRTEGLVELLPGAGITAPELEVLQSANLQGGGQSAGLLELLAFGEKPDRDLPVRFIIRGDL